MADCRASALQLKRGASLDALLRIPSRFADGQFAAWQPSAQLRTASGQLVAQLQVQWADAATARVLRLQALDTSAWPLEVLVFDVCLQGPAGERIYTADMRLAVLREVTHG